MTRSDLEVAISGAAGMKTEGMMGKALDEAKRLRNGDGADEEEQEGKEQRHAQTTQLRLPARTNEPKRFPGWCPQAN